LSNPKWYCRRITNDVADTAGPAQQQTSIQRHGTGHDFSPHLPVVYYNRRIVENREREKEREDEYNESSTNRIEIESNHKRQGRQTDSVSDDTYIALYIGNEQDGNVMLMRYINKQTNKQTNKQRNENENKNKKRRKAKDVV
jgi:hypothetical protein